MSFEKVRNHLSEIAHRTDRRLLVVALIAAEVLFLLSACISYYQRISNLDRREFTGERLQEYDGIYSYMGDRMEEGAEAGLYELLPASELLLRKGSYRCTVTYVSSSDGTFLQTNADTDYYNVMDSAVIWLTSDSDTAEEEFWLNADLNILLQIYYDGSGSVQILDLVIEETAAAANISLFFRILFLGVLDILLGVWYYHKKYSFSAKQIYLFFGLLTLGLAVSYPLLTGETLLGDDIYYHLYRIEGIKEGLLCGQFPVRISPVFYNGYGYATSIFYGELLLYFPALLRIIGFKLTTCYNVERSRKLYKARDSALFYMLLFFTSSKICEKI